MFFESVAVLQHRRRQAHPAAPQIDGRRRLVCRCGGRSTYAQEPPPLLAGREPPASGGRSRREGEADFNPIGEAVGMTSPLLPKIRRVVTDFFQRTRTRYFLWVLCSHVVLQYWALAE
jgi:hypothetical protein